MNASTRPPRVGVLWHGLSGYMHAALRTLQDRGVEVLVIRRESGDTSMSSDKANMAPFDPSLITSGLETYAWTGRPDVDMVREKLEQFQPDVLLVCSWHIGAYRKVAKEWKGKCLRLFSLSNPWRATAKQVGGIIVSRSVLHAAYDAAFICDERQAVFARKLGFPATRLIWGINTCDYSAFAKVATDRAGGVPESFLFVGRLVPDKAIDVLASAYRRYRSMVAEPWPLLIAGSGPDAGFVEGIEGIHMYGFAQPPDLPDLMAQAGCLVLPSRFEPWGVVIHEAAAAGLPVIASRECGASARLVLDGFNGRVVDAGDVDGLAKALMRISTAGTEERRELGEGSQLLARQYTPERWAKVFMSRVPELRAELGLTPRPWDAPEPRA